MNEKNKIVADSGNTITFSRVGEKETPHEVLMKVYYSMREKGYDPVSQIVRLPYFRRPDIYHEL